MHHNLTARAGDPNATSALKAKDVATALGINIQTVYLAIRQGDIAAYRVGSGRGTFRISRAAFDEYVADRGIPANALAVTA